jgi:hypothetical protein
MHKSVVYGVYKLALCIYVHIYIGVTCAHTKVENTQVPRSFLSWCPVGDKLLVTITVTSIILAYFGFFWGFG